MKLYYQAPFYKNTDFMAHLIEHCILHPDKQDIKQIGLSPWIGGYLSGERMWITFDHLEDKDTIFTIIKKPITQSIVDYEYTIFNEEFGSMGYVNRVLEKCNKLFFGEDRSKKPRSFTLEEIQDYHKNFISQGKYVLLDEKTNEIIEHNFNLKRLKTLENYSPPKLEYHLVYLEGQKNLIIAHQGSHVNSLVYLYFIFDIIKSRDFYNKRYQLESYYTHAPSDYYFIELSGMRISPHSSLDIPSEYFEFQKQYFIKELTSNNYPSITILSMLYNNELYELDKAVELVNKINYNDFMEIIQNIKNIA